MNKNIIIYFNVYIIIKILILKSSKIQNKKKEKAKTHLQQQKHEEAPYP